jgi:hypothetical protein
VIVSPLLLALATYAVTLIEMGRLLAAQGRGAAAKPGARTAVPSCGRVDAFGGAYLATTFVQLGGLPLLPVESRLFLDEENAAPEGETQALVPAGPGASASLPVPLDRRSVAAAYLRFYGSTLGFLGVLRLLVLVGLAPAAGVYVLLPWPLILPALGAAAAGWLWLGRLSRDEKAKRVVYWDYTGHFADPALLGTKRVSLRERLAREVAGLARALTGASYRDGYDPENAWRRLACDAGGPAAEEGSGASPRERVAFLRAALTLARVEWSLARGGDRADRAREHARIWENLKAAQPALLAEVDAYSLR